jgi:hypothetical protein
MVKLQRLKIPFQVAEGVFFAKRGKIVHCIFRKREGKYLFLRRGKGIDNSRENARRNLHDCVRRRVNAFRFADFARLLLEKLCARMVALLAEVNAAFHIEKVRGKRGTAANVTAREARQKARVANCAKLKDRFYYRQRLFALCYGEKAVERKAEQLRFVGMLCGNIARNVGNIACKRAALKRVSYIEKALYKRAIVDVVNVRGLAQYKFRIAEHLAANEGGAFELFRALCENGNLAVLRCKHSKHLIEIADGRFAYNKTLYGYKHGKTSSYFLERKQG